MTLYVWFSNYCFEKSKKKFCFGISKIEFFKFSGKDRVNWHQPFTINNILKSGWKGVADFFIEGGKMSERGIPLEKGGLNYKQHFTLILIVAYHICFNFGCFCDTYLQKLFHLRCLYYINLLNILILEMLSINRVTNIIQLNFSLRSKTRFAGSVLFYLTLHITTR